MKLLRLGIIFTTVIGMCCGCGREVINLTTEENPIAHGEGQVVGADKAFLSNVSSTQPETEKSEQKTVQEPVIEVGARMGNILNSGIVCERGEWIYFGKKEDANRLYRRNEIGVEQPVGEVSGAINLNVLSDRIIYQSGGIWEYSPDTDTARLLVEGSCRNVVVYGEKLFYLKKDGEIYKICSANMDGSDETILSPNIASFMNVVDERIYYIAGDDEGRIHQMNLDGTNDNTISSFGTVEEIVVEEDIIYYVSGSASGYQLWCITTDGKDDHKIYGSECHNINVQDDIIYFRNQKDGQLCSIRDDGTDLRNLTECQCTSINLTRDWVYYFNVDDMNYYRIRKDGTGNSLVE